MKKVKCINPIGILKLNETYLVVSETKDFYWVTNFNDVKAGGGGWFKERFKIISENEIETNQPVCLD